MSPKGHPPNENQRAWNQAGTKGMRKNAMRQARQIASQRQFPYEQSITCGSCGGPRGQSRTWKCSACEGAS